MEKQKKDTLIIYASIHKGNTEKIAERMGDVLGARAISIQNVKEGDVLSANLIGFGSGIYIGKFHKKLIDFVKKLPEVKGKKAFIFSTSGMKRNVAVNWSHNHFKGILEKKGYEVLGDFNCLGYDTYGPLKYVGGKNKGRPNEEDISSAKEFVRSVVKNNLK